MPLSTRMPNSVCARLISTLFTFGRVKCPLPALNQQNPEVNEVSSRITTGKRNHSEYWQHHRKRRAAEWRNAQSDAVMMWHYTLEFGRLKILLMDVPCLSRCFLLYTSRHNSWTSAWEGMESGKYFLSTLSRVNTQFSLTSYSIAQNSLLRTGLKDKKEPHELVQIFIRSKEGQKITNIINLKRKFCMIDKSVRSSIFVCGVSCAALSINLSADHPI